MNKDRETNFLYLADTLPVKYPDFYRRFKEVLEEHKVNFELLPGTKDVWAVDYMPIQVGKDNFLKFVYDPSYLKPAKYRKTISDVDTICRQIGIETTKSNIILDGGNVTRFADKVIMCDKVFDENKHIKEDDLLEQLTKELQVKKIIIIPTHPLDFTGHSDGMVRFCDDNTVIVSDYSKEATGFRRNFRYALLNAGLELVEVPYNPYGNGNDLNDCKGEYINYLQMEGVIVAPAFGMKEDKVALDIFREVFKGTSVASVGSKDLAKDGGILNCITWNIKR